jgi:hypothetical protein
VRTAMLRSGGNRHCGHHRSAKPGSAKWWISIERRLGLKRWVKRWLKRWLKLGRRHRLGLDTERHWYRDWHNSQSFLRVMGLSKWLTKN